MKVSEVTELLGSAVRFTSNRTKGSIEDMLWGIVQEIKGTEVLINDDWHDMQTLEIHDVKG